MAMQVMDAPPIFYSALSQMKVEDAGGTQTPEGYTLANFRQEVEDGQDVDGDTDKYRPETDIGHYLVSQ